MRYLTFSSSGLPIAIFNSKPFNNNYIIIDSSIKDSDLNLMKVDLNTLKLVPKEIIDDFSLKETEIRNQRNSLLKETDWTQLEDIPQELKNIYKKYRQSLRDLPLQEGFPDNVVWPVVF